MIIFIFFRVSHNWKNLVCRDTVFHSLFTFNSETGLDPWMDDKKLIGGQQRLDICDRPSIRGIEELLNLKCGCPPE